MATFERILPLPVDERADEVRVPMRDGAALATDLYLPIASGPSPTVLVREPYDKNGRYTFMSAIAGRFNERGYAFVVQDVRGKFRSGGDGIPTVPYVHEIEDGYATIDWIVAQPWSNGIVGMWGDSYYGWTQWGAVAAAHPALAAIVPRVATADAPTDRFLPTWSQAVPKLYFAELCTTCWLDENLYTFDLDWSRRPLTAVFEDAFAAAGGRSESVDDLVAGHARTARYDVYRGRTHPFDVVKIPVLNEGGWFDVVAPQQMRDYTTLSRSSRTASLQWLSMDSSDHDSYRLDDTPITADKDHESSDAGLDRWLDGYLRRGLEFFDVHLRGVPDRAPRVRWHLAHVGWREGDVWPPPDIDERRLFLSHGERARVDADGGALSPAPDAGETFAPWTHDPEDLVPSTVADPFAFLRQFPDERVVHDRSDVMTFTSDPFDAPLDLAGPVRVTVAVTSDAPSIPVFVKLTDVAPDGTARMLLRGDVLIGGPDGRPVEVLLGHLGYRVQPRHRLRVHIAASDFPLFAWHPGTAENPWHAIRSVPRAIHLDTSGGSVLVLTALRTRVG